MGDNPKRRSWKKVFLLSLFVTIGAFVWLILNTGSGYFSKEVIVSDVTKPVLLTVKAADEQNVVAVALRLYGHLDGKAAISWASVTQLVSGTFDVEVRHVDWYQPNMVISYFPTNVSKGAVHIQYEF